MKVLAKEHVPVTNVEILAWLREKSFDVDKSELSLAHIRTPKNTAEITEAVRKYITSSPPAHVTVDSLSSLFAKLERFKLSRPELIMIANVRPEAYAHLTALIPDCDNRYGETQVQEILDIINTTLEPRYRAAGSGPAPTGGTSGEDNKGAEAEPSNGDDMMDTSAAPDDSKQPADPDHDDAVADTTTASKSEPTNVADGTVTNLSGAEPLAPQQDS